MSVVIPTKLEPWTVDDLPDDGRRYEIVDGTLLVSPAPSMRHDVMLFNLLHELAAQLGQKFRVLGPAGLTFAPTNYRIPDLLVVDGSIDLWNAKHISPSDVTLAVEVVSPSSITTDRITKPAQYAAAGIPAYWRIETDPLLTLTAYVLAEDVYAEVGHWVEGETVELDEPFAVRFAIDDLRR